MSHYRVLKYGAFMQWNEAKKKKKKEMRKLFMY